MVSTPLRRPDYRVAIALTRLLLTLVVAFAVAVPVGGYIYAHHLVLLGARVSTPRRASVAVGDGDLPGLRHRRPVHLRRAGLQRPDDPPGGRVEHQAEPDDRRQARSPRSWRCCRRPGSSR